MGWFSKIIFLLIFFYVFTALVTSLMEEEKNEHEPRSSAPRVAQTKPKTKHTEGINPYLAIRLGKDVIRHHLKDPDSARFRKVCMTKDGVVFGKVNGKNSFGAYTGYRDFVVLGNLAAIDSPFRKEHREFVKIWNTFVAKKKIKKCLD